MTEEPQYRARTWDTEREEFTAQDGIPEYVSGFRGLLGAVRLLRENGYPANRDRYGSDPSVLIERLPPTV